MKGVFSVLASISCRVCRQGAGRSIRRLSRMPRLRYLWPIHGWRSATSAALVAAGAVLVLPGCSSVPTTAGPIAPQPTAAHEAMFPSLKLNDDLLKSFKPSNHRDWTPEQAVLAHAEFMGNRVDGPQHPQLPLAERRRFHRGVLRQDLRSGQTRRRSTSSSCRSTRRPASATRCSVSASTTRTIWPYRWRFAGSAARRTARSRVSFSSTNSCTSWPTNAT